MLEAVAVMSDIHGVLPALDAVLAEPEVIDADRIVVTGDIAAGPQPVEVLDRLIGLGERVVLVRGNADRELVAMARGGGGEPPDPISPWAASVLRPDQVELLASLPHPLVLDIHGFGRVLFCHGTPRDEDEVVLVDTRLAKWAEVLADIPSDIETIVCGHTHMPFVRLAHRRLIVNPGSVGMPYGRAGAHWCLLRDGGVTLRRTAFDIDAARRAIAESSRYGAADEWTDYYLNSRASDAEAVEAFGPRDGRSSPN